MGHKAVSGPDSSGQWSRPVGVEVYAPLASPGEIGCLYLFADGALLETFEVHPFEVPPDAYPAPCVIDSGIDLENPE